MASGSNLTREFLIRILGGGWHNHNQIRAFLFTKILTSQQKRGAKHLTSNGEFDLSPIHCSCSVGSEYLLRSLFTS